MIIDYFNYLNRKVRFRIKNDLSSNNLPGIIQQDLAYHISSENSSDKFNEYYFKVTGDHQGFLSDKNFFSKFKYQYSLQGVDSNLLDKLESNKSNILSLISNDNSLPVYLKYFDSVATRHGDKTILKDFGSFYSKLAHTLQPMKYCALDNPIKSYFNLDKESFVVAFIVISHAYQEWTSSNQTSLLKLRKGLKEIDHASIIDHDKITDMKIMDMIFWYKANVKQK